MQPARFTRRRARALLHVGGHWPGAIERGSFGQMSLRTTICLVSWALAAALVTVVVLKPATSQSRAHSVYGAGQVYLPWPCWTVRVLDRPYGLVGYGPDCSLLTMGGRSWMIRLPITQCAALVVAIVVLAVGVPTGVACSNLPGLAGQPAPVEHQLACSGPAARCGCTLH
jgi:hypothetical protein